MNERREAPIEVDEDMPKEKRTTVTCECGEWSGERCTWSGSVDETVMVEYMPEHFRASHTAASGRPGLVGIYPVNGADRIRVERSCADRMIEHDGDWARILA